MLVGQNSDSELYDWHIEHYEAQPRYCWSIEEIPQHKVWKCFSVPLIPKIFEKKVRKYAKLVLMSTNSTNLLALWSREIFSNNTR